MTRTILIGLLLLGACATSPPDPQQPDDEEEETTTQASSSQCGVGCSVGASAICNPLTSYVGLFCGFASAAICDDACADTLHRKCAHLPGGKACMTTTRMWWCDSRVDGRGVTVQYELSDLANPGIKETSAAPSQACSDVRWPTWDITRRFRICVTHEGCSGWVWK